jgi:hypothetical protein
MLTKIMPKSKVMLSLETPRGSRYSGATCSHFTATGCSPEIKDNEMSNDKHDTVTVTYNGADEEVRYQPNAAIQALLEHAKQAFGLQNSPNNHLLALFTEDGVELDDTKSAADAGVKPGMLLVLRQSTVKGGA